MPTKISWIDSDTIDKTHKVRVSVGAMSEDGLPYFVHKWTKRRTRYRQEHLLLPEKMNTFGIDFSRLRDKPSIGVGGTRAPTVETFNYTNTLCRLLASDGVVIVSGCVPGVDLAAHMGAVDVKGGSSICVMANPSSFQSSGHGMRARSLDSFITKTGCFISEYSFFAETSSADYLERLLQRDRIISGLGQIFLAFECNADSATLDTAVRAALQGAAVFIIHPIAASRRLGTYSLKEKLAGITSRVIEFNMQSDIADIVRAARSILV